MEEHNVTTPISKLAKTNKCLEFCSINIVPIYEKLLELVVNDRLLNHSK